VSDEKTFEEEIMGTLVDRVRSSGCLEGRDEFSFRAALSSSIVMLPAHVETATKKAVYEEIRNRFIRKLFEGNGKS
jgi:hypothetical protein